MIEQDVVSKSKLIVNNFFIIIVLISLIQTIFSHEKFHLIQLMEVELNFQLTPSYISIHLTGIGFDSTNNKSI